MLSVTMLSFFPELILAADFSPAETLFLKDGTSSTGHSRGFRNGRLLWQRANGLTKPISLDEIDRVEYPRRPANPIDLFDSASNSVGSGSSAQNDPEHGVPGLQPTLRSIKDLFHESLDGFSTWTKRIEAGGRFLDGNSDEDFINAAGRFEREKGNSVGQLEFAGQYGRSDGDVTSNRWNANVTYDYGRHGKWIVFATAKNEYDEFENLDYRGTYSSGIGYRFFREKDRRLIVRVGPAVTYERFRDPVVNRTTPDGFGELEWNWPLLSRSSFESKTTVHPSLSEISVVRVVSNNGLLFRLDEHGRWRLKIGFRFEYNSKPNEGRLPADFTTSVLIVYAQK